MQINMQCSYNICIPKSLIPTSHRTLNPNISPPQGAQTSTARSDTQRGFRDVLEGVDCMNVSWLYAVCYFYLLCYNVTMIYILYVLYFNHCDAVRLFALWYILFIRIVRNLIYILSYTADHVEVCGSSVGSRPMHGWFKAHARLVQGPYTAGSSFYG